MKKLHFIAWMLISVAGMAQKKKMKQDAEAILAMCGCYDISFQFAETFGESKDYEYHKNYYSGALEYAFPLLQEDDKVVIQHLLVINDSTVIKHWRQDWLYENTDLYTYDYDDRWKYEQLPVSRVKGQWTQKVFQVDDSPRYEGSATWVHVDGRHFWESEVDAPLPRREYRKRKDYNVMVRRNRHEITEDGWMHEQDNQKVLRSQEGDTRLAQEKGLNSYTRVAESKCQPAIDWWAANQQYWADVRAVWDQVFASKKPLELDMKAGGKSMFKRLFALGEEMSGIAYESKTSKERIREVIQLHMKSDIKVAVY